MLPIVYEDKYILAVHKPAGVATQTSRVSEPDVVSMAKAYIAEKMRSHGDKREPYIALINRLDKPVEGIVLMALNSKTAANLSRMLTDGKIRKEYVALVSAESSFANDDCVTLTDLLLHDQKTNLTSVVAEGTPDVKKAVLKYRVLSYAPEREYALVHIDLITGRPHQIRVQMAHAGHPVLGDRKYGNTHSDGISSKLGVTCVALCAYKLSFTHPVTNDIISLRVNSNTGLLSDASLDV